MYHGISAYSKETRVHALIQRVEIVASVEACWADIPIGNIGVFCDIEHADVNFISEKDAWSYVNWRGERCTNLSDIWGDNIVYSDNSYSTYCEMRSTKTGRYIEICATAEPDAIWVKRNASKYYQKLARVLARKYKLPLMEV